MKEVSQSFATGPIYNIHDAIIQTLDRDLGWDEYGNRQIFSPDVYESALSTVSDSLIIYSPTGVHADAYKYEENPEEAISAIGGRIAGKILQPYIDKTGHPTVRGKLAFEPDQEIEKLISEGHLSLSPAVWTTYDDNGNVIRVRFQNLLIFPEIPGGPYVPGDPGTIILNSKPNNKTGTNMTETQGGAAIAPQLDPQQLSSLVEMVSQFTAFQKKVEEREAESAKKAEEREAQFSKLLEDEKQKRLSLESAIKAEKEAQKEAEWISVFTNPLLPEGMKKIPEEQLKKEFYESPATFTNKLMSVFSMQNNFIGTHGEQGQQFTKEKSEDPVSEMYSKGKTMFDKFGLTPEDLKKVV